MDSLGKWLLVGEYSVAAILLPVVVGAFLYGLWLRIKHAFASIVHKLRSAKMAWYPGRSAREPFAWMYLWRIVVNLWVRLAHAPVWFTLALAALLSAGAVQLFLPYLPKSLAGGTGGVAFIALSVLLMDFVTRPFGEREWALSIVPVLYGLIGYIAMLLMVIVGISSLAIPFSAILLVLLFLLLPVMAFVRNVLNGPFNSALKLWIVLTSMAVLLGFILFSFGLFNLSQIPNGLSITDSSKARLIMRVMYFGTKNLFSVPDPALPGSLVPFTQYLVGFLFNTVVLGVLVAAFSNLFIPPPVQAKGTKTALNKD